MARNAAEIYAEEMKHICDYRAVLKHGQQHLLTETAAYWSIPSTALCLSGGGIRSAAFAMGFLQAFCERRLIRYIDYISAVSGGGYAAAWLSSTLCRSPQGKDARDHDEALSAIAAVERQIGSATTQEVGPRDTTTLREPFERRYVRAHGNYLTIRTGMFAADTWAMIFTVIRNSAYSIVGLGLLLVAVAALALLLVPLTASVNAAQHKGYIGVGGLLCLMVGWFAVCYQNSADISRSLAPAPESGHSRESDAPDRVKHRRSSDAQTALRLRSLRLWIPHAAVTIGMLLASIYVVLESKQRGFDSTPYSPAVLSRDWLHAWPASVQWTFGVLIAMCLLFALAIVISKHWTAGFRHCARKFAGEPLVWLSTLGWFGALVALLSVRAPGEAFYAYAIWYFMAIGWAFERCVMRDRELAGTAHPDHRTVDLKTAMSALFGILLGALGAYAAPHGLAPVIRLIEPAGPLVTAAVVMMVLALTATIMVSVVIFAQGDQNTPMNREWWARWSGEHTVWALACAAILLLVGASHLGVESSRPAFELLQNRMGLALTMFALLAVASTTLKGPLGRAVGRICGMLSVLTLLLLALLLARQFSEAWGLSLVGGQLPFTAYALTAVVALAISLLAVNISSPNTFSMHELYKHRLVRAFLGSSNPQPRVVPYVGLANEDDFDLKEMRFGAGRSTLDELQSRTRVPLVARPFPIWGAAVNVTNSTVLGLLERKAASFIFSPLNCGFEEYLADRQRRYQGRTSTKPYASAGTYRDPAECGLAQPAGRPEYKIESMTVGLAMSVSGAAFSSNSGATTRPERSLMLTFLGLRLGYWLPNPASHLAWRLGSACGRVRPAGTPWFHDLFRAARWPMNWLAKEAMADCDIEANGVYVSDGGHFENLGVYEMLRRQVELIVVSDATCDPLYRFDDLLNLIAKARADFSIEVVFETPLNALAPSASSGTSKTHCTDATVIYQRDASGQPCKTGRLIYCKASVTGDEDADLLMYRKRNQSFPHLSTVNQWFAESVFEAYRGLGLHIGRHAAESFWRRISMPTSTT